MHDSICDYYVPGKTSVSRFQPPSYDYNKILRRMDYNNSVPKNTCNNYVTHFVKARVKFVVISIIIHTRGMKMRGEINA